MEMDHFLQQKAGWAARGTRCETQRARPAARRGSYVKWLPRPAAGRDCVPLAAVPMQK